jgi:hypothetical protein
VKFLLAGGLTTLLVLYLARRPADINTPVSVTRIELPARAAL